MPYRDRFSIEILKLCDRGNIEQFSADWFDAAECDSGPTLLDTGQVDVINSLLGRRVYFAGCGHRSCLFGSSVSQVHVQLQGWLIQPKSAKI